MQTLLCAAPFAPLNVHEEFMRWQHSRVDQIRGMTSRPAPCCQGNLQDFGEGAGILSAQDSGLSTPDSDSGDSPQA